MKTGQQGIVDLLTRITQISQRLFPVKPNDLTRSRTESAIGDRHRTSATFSAQAAARATAGLFIVYTCNPSTPCSCKSVS